ncbi:hypothetical protein PF011_g30520 [Phytophthora fragariae]|uniref:RxLR effector protein n=1 Tax=Phytophthora fragariae TaxID=53985 RepID=A0A6A3GL44_9STRA|nr:hypothetical protein PF011_g30520 [Phytophthora fragariae]
MVPVLPKITTLLAVMPLIRVVAIKAFGVSNMKSPDMAPIVVLANARHHHDARHEQDEHSVPDGRDGSNKHSGIASVRGDQEEPEERVNVCVLEVHEVAKVV